MMRSRFNLTCLAAAVALAITAVSGSAAGPSPSPSVREGSPLRDPPQLVSQNGILRARLVVERRQVDVAGRKLWALT
jgi:suppressor of ftsI